MPTETKASIQRKLDASTAIIAVQNKKINNLDGKVVALSRAVAELVQARTDLCATIDSLAMEANDLRGKLYETDKYATAAKASIVDRTKERDDLQKLSDDLAVELKKTYGNWLKAREERDQFRDKAYEQIVLVQRQGKQIDDLKAHNVHIRDCLQDFKTQFADASKQALDAEITCGELRAELETANETIADNAANLLNHEIQAGMQADIIVRLRDVVERLQTQSFTIEHQLDNTVAAWEAERALRKQRALKRQSYVVMLERELRTARLAAADKQRLANGNEMLVDRLVVLQSELKASKSAYDWLYTRNADKSKRLALLHRQIAEDRQRRERGLITKALDWFALRFYGVGRG